MLDNFSPEKSIVNHVLQLLVIFFFLLGKKERQNQKIHILIKASKSQWTVISTNEII